MILQSFFLTYIDKLIPSWQMFDIFSFIYAEVMIPSQPTHCKIENERKKETKQKKKKIIIVSLGEFPAFRCDPFMNSALPLRVTRWKKKKMTTVTASYFLK